MKTSSVGDIKKLPENPFLYVDGSASNGSAGPAGWAFAWKHKGTVHARAGYSVNATANQMEIQAVIEAMSFFPANSKLTITSDSQYVVNGVNDWLPKWKKRNWRRVRRRGKHSKAGPLKNKELWQQIDQLIGTMKSVLMKWEPAHSGEPMNELCDSLCGEAARQQKAIQISIPADQL